jgi:DNA-binding PadR family transcriptional regulator
MLELNQIIQRDLLVAVNGLGPVSGQEVAAELEEKYGKKVTNARLYDNLDGLCTMGLVQKNKNTGGRHNEYTITPRGKREIAAYHGWLEGHIRA